jgi:hypothetical protein
VRKTLAAWKYIQPHGITKTYPDEEKKEWKFCTKCTCKATGKKVFFQLSHLDAEHKENYRPQANLSHVDDPNYHVPAGPPLVTTKEPDEKEDDQDEIFFNGVSAWCCVVPDALSSETTFTRVLVEASPDDNYVKVDNEDDSFPPLGEPRWDESSSNEDGSVLEFKGRWNTDDGITKEVPVLLDWEEFSTNYSEENGSKDVSNVCNNENSSDKPPSNVPKSTMIYGWLLYMLGLVMTASAYLWNGAAVAILGPDMKFNKGAVELQCTCL